MRCKKVTSNSSWTGRDTSWTRKCLPARSACEASLKKTKNNLKNKQKRNKNQSGCEPLNLENKLWKGVTRHCSSRKYLWCEGSLTFEQAHEAFFHSGVCCDIYKMKTFDVKKLFVSQACLHVLHHMYLYMSSLCCSQKRQDHFVWSKVRYRLSEILEPALRKSIINILAFTVTDVL